MNILKKLMNEEKGQALTEYGLILMLVAVALVTALGVLKGAISSVFDKVKTSLGV